MAEVTSMELKEEHFLKLKDKKKHAEKNISYMVKLADELKSFDKFTANSLYRRAERMDNCLKYWEWEKYEKNKVLALLRVSRCKDPFCPNCRRQNVFKSIINFTPAFNMMMFYQYFSFLMTLTVPNISREYLSQEISKMNKTFSKLWRWLYRPYNKDGKYGGVYKDRIFDAVGAVKALEVTVQKSDWTMFHVHFHVIIFLENICEFDFEKKYDGGYQYNTKSYILYSDADIFIQKLWKMAYDDKDIIEFENASDDWQDNYICDIRYLSMPQGIYEVFKYCFKDSDIKNYDTFKYLFFGIKGKRLKQGYGQLYGMDLKDWNFFKYEAYPEPIFLEGKIFEFEDEVPTIVVTKCINEMTEKYKDFKKISGCCYNKRI